MYLFFFLQSDIRNVHIIPNRCFIEDMVLLTVMTEKANGTIILPYQWPRYSAFLFRFSLLF
jgi:hypothetical protein